MRKRRAGLIAMISFTILLCVCMVQFPTDFISAADSSYTTMGGISAGDQLSDGAVLPWPSIEGVTVVNSYVYIYQDAWGATDTLFRSFRQENGKTFTMPLYDELKGSFWLYMPKGETFGYWKVTGMTADVSEKVVTFFWHIKLVRQKTDNAPGSETPENPGTSGSETPEPPGTSGSETPENPGTSGDGNTGSGNDPSGSETPGNPDTSGSGNTGAGNGSAENPGTSGSGNTGAGNGSAENPGTSGGSKPDGGENELPVDSNTSQNPPKTTGSTKISAAGTYHLSAGTTYVLDGPVGVKGDHSCYASGISFQVDKNGNYTFR